MTILDKPELPSLEPQDTGEFRRLWTREEYYQAAELGWFSGERVELIRGEVYRKLTQKPPHATAVSLTAKALERVIDPHLHVRAQLPLPMLNDSDPEPDVLVAIGTILDYAERHPQPAEVMLIIEISDTTLQYDRNGKASIYAQAGIADYWIVNLQSRTLEIYRDPTSDEANSTTSGYRTVVYCSPGESVTPLALPEATIPVADLLPPVRQNA